VGSIGPVDADGSVPAPLSGATCDMASTGRAAGGPGVSGG
jgi:hypothetical protein